MVRNDHWSSEMVMSGHKLFVVVKIGGINQRVEVGDCEWRWEIRIGNRDKVGDWK